jgi:hypothetical protein
MTDTASRPMDEPNISPLEFLFAVMHDPACDLQHRIDAAVKLLELGMGQYSHVPKVHITIRGGLEHSTLKVQPDFQWHRRVYKDLYGWDVKGHA